MTTTGPRHELLPAAASDLLATRGCHAAGIDDTGAAAGIVDSALDAEDRRTALRDWRWRPCWAASAG